ncbi:MAG TPA: SRPBCC family protein [Candidatus Limnocylindrales bacterium]|nr:SRPBCC family protein [Candidatus Limnocylindrales bacterium]
MTSTVSIEVAAPPDLVFRLAHDVERWPSLLPHYVSVRVERRADGGAALVRFVAVRPLVRRLGIGVPVAWRAISWNEPGEWRLRFRHVGGPTAGMDVTWRIEPATDGCRVSIEHDFRPRIRPWAAIVDRLFVRPIAGRTLATFKAIAEATSAAS